MSQITCLRCKQPIDANVEQCPACGDHRAARPADMTILLRQPALRQTAHFIFICVYAKSDSLSIYLLGLHESSYVTLTAFQCLTGSPRKGRASSGRVRVFA